jgi:hypothetical protein
MSYIFPQFRKYIHAAVYFKIISEQEFEEISFVGKKAFKVRIIAHQYPEYIRIQDMLLCEGGAWEVIPEEMYESKKASQ